eukprot:scaffold386953_cov55-Prasinocladus_malaysianus.AAC.2
MEDQLANQAKSAGYLVLRWPVVALYPQVVLRRREQQFVWNLSSGREMGCGRGLQSPSQRPMALTEHHSAADAPRLLTSLPRPSHADGSILQPVNL